MYSLGSVLSIWFQIPRFLQHPRPFDVPVHVRRDARSDGVGADVEAGESFGFCRTFPQAALKAAQMCAFVGITDLFYVVTELRMGMALLHPANS